MNRFTRALLGALLLVTAFASVALAEWKLEPVKWSHPGITSTTDFGAVALATHRGWVKDTTWVPIAAARIDTTAEFSLMNCETPTAQDFGSTGSTVDSLAGAWVFFVPDSNVASTIVWGAATVSIQANYGQGANWQTVYTYTADPTSGQKQLAIPIFVRAGITTDLGPKLDFPMGAFAPRCRAIFTGGTSAAGPSTRVYVKKFVGKGSVEHDAQNW